MVQAPTPPVPAFLVAPARRAPATWRLSPRQLCDLELLGGGGFAPLRSFLGRADHESVCQRMRLADGTLWPMPVMLDVPDQVLGAAAESGVLHLQDPAGADLARLEITEAWRADHRAEAESVLGTTDRAHPGARHLLTATHPWYVTGPLTIHRLPRHPDLPPLVHTVSQVRAELAARGWSRTVAFNTRNPMHGAHRALVLRAAAEEDAGVLVHPVVGVTRPGDVPAAVRARCYQALLRTLPPDRFHLALLPLAMRMAGPREALWHAIIRRTFGATAFVVGRDHAGPGVDSRGRPFYDPLASQRLVAAHQREIGIHALCFPELVYVDGLGFVPEAEVPRGRTALRVSGTRLRALLAERAAIPSWLAPAEVVEELLRAAPATAS